MKRPFIHEDFLLHTETARQLYHGMRRGRAHLRLPLPPAPRQMPPTASSRTSTRSGSAGDHYKWRAMRANGVSRTSSRAMSPRPRQVPGLRAHGAADPAQPALPLVAPGAEPLFRDRRRLIGDDGAAQIWEKANASCHPLSVHGILTKSRSPSSARPTTPPTRSTTTQAIAAAGLGTRVYPAFRPDKALRVATCRRLQRLGASGSRRRANVEICTSTTFSGALKQRHDDFHEAGGPAIGSRHGAALPRPAPSAQAAAHLHRGARREERAAPEHAARFSSS